MQCLLVILKCHNLQSLDKALGLFIEFKLCESDFCFLNGSKNCMVATYNFGLVYMKYLYVKFTCLQYVWYCYLKYGLKFYQRKY